MIKLQKTIKKRNDRSNKFLIEKKKKINEKREINYFYLKNGFRFELKKINYHIFAYRTFFHSLDKISTMIYFSKNDSQFQE